MGAFRRTLEILREPCGNLEGALREIVENRWESKFSLRDFFRGVLFVAFLVSFLPCGALAGTLREIVENRWESKFSLRCFFRGVVFVVFWCLFYLAGRLRAPCGKSLGVELWLAGFFLPGTNVPLNL